MIHTSYVEQPFEVFARQMMEAVTEACRLPQGQVRDGLLIELTTFMKIASHPMVMAVEGPPK